MPGIMRSTYLRQFYALLAAAVFFMGCDAVPPEGPDGTPTPTPPTIASFTASPSTIVSGNSTTLNWNVTNATSLSIDNGIGTTTGTSRSVTPSATTTYKLTASNGAGNVSAAVTVTVNQPAPTPAPTITSFSASPATIAVGDSTTLNWNVANATSLSIDSGVGAVTGSNRSVSPTQTTTYKLTATNATGSVTATTAVTVNSVSTQLPVTLRWDRPMPAATVSGTTQFRLVGQSFENVEIFRNGAMVVRATVSADKTVATANIDSTQLPNGQVTFTAHAWNSAAGTPFTSDADAGSLTVTVSNASPTAPFWFSGTDGLSREFHNNFGAWRGRPSTSTWINLLWLPWDWLTAPGLSSTSDGMTPNVKVWDLYSDFPGVVVLSMSMAGNGNVDRAVYEDNMRACANGAYNTHWEKFGANAAAAGRNGSNTVVSLAQEFNGTWFKWNPKNVGLSVWLGCWKNVYASIKKNSSIKVAWVFSASTVTSNAGADWAVNNVWDAYPGDAFVDVIGVNHYDFKMFGASTTNWRDHCWNTQDFCYAAKYAREHGKPLGIPEWGPDREVGYADNAEFITMMYGFFNDNRDVLLFETTFNTILGGTPGWWHVYPEGSANAKAAARYKQLWRSN